MVSPVLLSLKGLLPIRSGSVRFAVGSPSGLSSNSWKIWAGKHGDIYIACRDNMTGVKVSLHASGRWRVGFTTEAVQKNPALISEDENRAWDVWDKPPETIPNAVMAFRLFFLNSELALVPQDRVGKLWKKVVYIEAPPEGKMTAVTLFVSNGDFPISHASEPSFCLASYAIGNGLYAKVIAHGEPEGDIRRHIESTVKDACSSMISKGLQLPLEAYGYFLLKNADGARFIVGAKLNRPLN